MAWERRPQAEVQMGNGTLLATFDSNAEVDQLFAPNIDALQSRLGAFQTSVLIPSDQGHGPQMIRLNSGSFDIRMRLHHGSQVLQAEYHHKSQQIRLQRTLGMHPTEPIILDRWKILEGRVGLFHESVPWMGNSTSAHCSLYHPNFNGLVHHRGRRWLGVMAKGPTQWVRVGHLSEHDRYRLWGGEKVDVPVGGHDLGGFPSGPVRVGWDQVVQGPATWGSFAMGPAEEIEMVIICAESERHLGRLLQLIQHIPTQRYFEMIESQVARRHAPALPILEQITNPAVRQLCERSIDVLHALQDARTGALMAAAEVDPHSKVSGGYGYSWPRDGAYLANALGAFNFHDRVTHYFHFLADTQDPSGAWWQRYLATGHAGPSWGRIQIDEPAAVIAAAFLHYRRTHDLFWLEKFWPTIEKGLQFLEEFHSPEHPMGLPSHDLWEERMGIHAYSLGGVSSAFLCGAYLARELSDRKAQSKYYKLSRRLLSTLRENFLPENQHPRRAFIVNSWDYQRGGGWWDEATDCSMLGLINPFKVLGKRDNSARRIVHDIRQKLWSSPTGGLLRYERDTYRGGNPWILCTLWLGMVDLEFGDIYGARETFQWVMSKQTQVGMLAEQVHRESGHPFWVIPLGWSHAMYLTFVRDVIERRLQLEIWGQG
jgi:hypothetical protein